jgi:hypothetical protein
MNKWAGVIGFAQTVKSETKPSVWEEEITERRYYGDILRNYRRNETQSDSPNDNINLNNQLSVVSDTFMYDNFQYMKYVTWMNSKWSIKSVELQYPRVIIEIGGVYNA